MKSIKLMFLILIMHSVISCEKTKKQADEFKPVNFTEKQQQVVASSNEFGFEFFRKVAAYADNGSNLMVSPLSVSMALGMTRNGAGSSTLDSMNKALFFTELSESEINEAYKTIVETFGNLDPDVQMQIANSLWNRDGFGVNEDFLNTNKNFFNAEVASLDFANPEAVTTINNWVDEKTNHLISKIVDQIPAEAVMYLINAIYFKGQWKYQFEKDATEDKAFYINGNAVPVPTMLQRTDLNYFSNTVFEAVEMPYNQGNFNCTLLLPAAGYSTDDVIEQLNLVNWIAWNEQFIKKDIQIELPKFKYAYEEKRMKEVLSDMGMAIAFSENLADFSRINAEYQLFISDVKHKTFIETNEEGTEAAAVTSVEVGVTSINPDDPQPYHLKINKPFVYVITEKASQTILFIGIVNNPLL